MKFFSMLFKAFFFIALLAVVAATAEEDQQQHTYTGELKDAPLVGAINARNDAAGPYGSSYGSQPAAAAASTTA